MIRVKLTCGHVFETGILSKEEEHTKSTICPVCGKIAGIRSTHKLKHPPNSKIKWVEAER